MSSWNVPHRVQEAVWRETPEVSSACNDSLLPQTLHWHTEGPVPASDPETPVSDDWEHQGTPVAGHQEDLHRPICKD